MQPYNNKLVVFSTTHGRELLLNMAAELNKVRLLVDADMSTATGCKPPADTVFKTHAHAPRTMHHHSIYLGICTRI